MSDISDFSGNDEFSDGEKQRKLFNRKSRNSTLQKKNTTDKAESLSKMSSAKSSDNIQEENRKTSIQKSETLKSTKSLNTKRGSQDEHILNSNDSKSFKNQYSASKLKDEGKSNTNPNARVADCVMSPPEFFLSHIYHDNKVFTKKYGHSIVEYENEFFIYGGINSHNEYLDEFLIFTYGPNTFTSKKLSVNPGKRAYSSMTLTYNANYNPSLLVFGGLCGPNIVAKDCYMYDFSEDAWSKYSYRLDSIPGSRFGHAYTFCPSTYTTIIWGGLNRNNELLKTGYKFVGGEWSEIKHKGISPSGRVFSSLVWLDRTTKDNISYSFLYLFGGDLNSKGSPTDELWVYNIKNENWTLVKNSSGEAPCARWKHGAVIIDKNMWISGGLCSGWFSNYSIPDLYVYDIPSNCWFNCQIASKQIHNCYDYGTLNLHSQTKAFFLFGGKNANNDPTSNVCRFAPLCTSVSIMTMRNEIKRFSNYVLEVKKESEETANNVSEMQKIIHTYSLDIKDFKILFEALTRSIQMLNVHIENIDREVSLLKKKNSGNDEKKENNENNENDENNRSNGNNEKNDPKDIAPTNVDNTTKKESTECEVNKAGEDKTQE
ncbi:kelch domain-containing protein [Plasmodium brasilianum]|uniref:Unspecified product n=2 Tax=Plasmodium (Plasmodium) TaxID=418103 RepID=A0A1A8WF42_PLAMA|nr:kelch domain-containing protein [Plasmodium brasilianum]SBS90672.1 unspecified product [Plasmodium malariae]